METSPTTGMARLLIGAGAVLLVFGVILLIAERTGILGRLPGDIIVRRKNWTLWVPLASSLLLSLILTLVLNLLRRR